MSVVAIEPAELLTFTLSKSNQSKASLKIRNTSTGRIAFKVKTTKPKRYLVRPNQGLIDVDRDSTVTVILQQKDCEELIEGKEDTGSSDKFLVQSVKIEDDFFDSVSMKQQKVRCLLHAVPHLT